MRPTIRTILFSGYGFFIISSKNEIIKAYAAYILWVVYACDIPLGAKKKTIKKIRTVLK